MIRRDVLRATGLIAAALAVMAGLVAGTFYVWQGVFVYHPTHEPAPKELAPWHVHGELFGYAREAASPRAVWLVLQGNTGQAGVRGYFSNVPADESIYVLEYPGYGLRAGEPARETIDAAAREAYRELRRRFPGASIGVIGESFGSGPVCALASEAAPPDRLVLFVPFARFDLLMDRFIPVLPMRLLLRDRWDNPSSLKTFRGPITIYAAQDDRAVPREQTEMLAAAVPQAKVVWLSGGHGDASEDPGVRLDR